MLLRDALADPCHSCLTLHMKPGRDAVAADRKRGDRDRRGRTEVARRARALVDKAVSKARASGKVGDALKQAILEAHAAHGGGGSGGGGGEVVAASSMLPPSAATSLCITFQTAWEASGMYFCLPSTVCPQLTYFIYRVLRCPAAGGASSRVLVQAI